MATGALLIVLRGSEWANELGRKQYPVPMKWTNPSLAPLVLGATWQVVIVDSFLPQCISCYLPRHGDTAFADQLNSVNKTMTFNSQNLFNFVISHMRGSRLQNNTQIVSHCLSYAVRENSHLTRHSIEGNRIDNRWHTMKSFIALRFCMIVLVPRLSAHTWGQCWTEF